MSTQRIFRSILLLVLMVFAVPLFGQTASQLFEQGLLKEQGEGDLRGAITLFERIVQDEYADRAVGAKAQLRVALCKEKLGLQEAQKEYQRVIDGYPEFHQEVAIAKERLGKLSLLAQSILKPSTTVRKVWAGPQADNSGSPSPDGLCLSYMDLATGNLAVRDLNSGITQLLTKEGTWDDPMQFTIGSVFSPDNQQIAYSWYNLEENYEIRLLDIQGKKFRRLYGNKQEDVYPVAWSSDNKLLYARSYLNDDGVCRILEINVPEGDIRILKTFDFFYWMNISCSPNTPYIVYDTPYKKGAGQFDIHILSLNTLEEKAFVDHPANDRLLGWFPDGNYILMKSDRFGTWDAWVVPVVDGDGAGEPQRVKTELGRVSPMGFAQDGAYYYSIFSRQFSAFTAPMDLEKGALQPEAKEPILGSIYWAEWSPDGKSLAIIKELTEPAGPGQYHRPLFILDTSSGKERRVSGNIEVRDPCWSSDGKTLLALGFDKDRADQTEYYGAIYTMDVTSGDVEELLAFPEREEGARGYSWIESAVEWSRDEKSIFYIFNDDVVERNVATGQERILIRGERFDRTLDLSPDGKTLLFSERNGLKTMPVSGGEAKQIHSTDEGHWIRKAIWTPDGQYILFSENFPNINQGCILWRISVDGQELKKVWQNNHHNSGISIHPDGQRITLSSFRQESEVWAMENFLPETN